MERRRRIETQCCYHILFSLAFRGGSLSRKSCTFLCVHLSAVVVCFRSMLGSRV